MAKDLNNSEGTREYLKKLAIRSVDKLEEVDRHILLVEANERSITHKLAMHIETLLRLDGILDWDVDAEYNRDLSSEKVSHIKPEDIRTDDDEAHTVFPDIIIHRRDSPQNLLVIECKKLRRPDIDDRDDHKVCEYTKNKPDSLCYTFGLLLGIGVGGNLGENIFSWYERGEDVGFS